MLLHRVLTALVGVPIIVGAIWFGPPWLTVVVVAVAVIGVGEAYRLYPPVAPPVATSNASLDAPSDAPSDDRDFDDGESPTKLPILLGGTWAVALALAGELAGQTRDFVLTAAVICVVGCIIAGLWMIAAWHGRRPIVAALYLVATPVYIGGALACAVALRAMVGDDIPLPTDTISDTISEAGNQWLLPTIAGNEIAGNELSDDLAIPAPVITPDQPLAGVNGVWLLPRLVGGEFAATVANLTPAGCWWLLLGILTVYATDTGAYTVGRLFGRHPMAPSISPGKNWEGAAGGMAGAVIAAVALGVLFPLQLDIWQLVGIGVMLGIVSPVGDLFESKIKRLADVKDSGNLFPGHGGMLDRLDSLLPSLTVVYILAAVFAATS